MKPDFSNIDITSGNCGAAPAAAGDAADWITPELIPVKSVYTAADLEGLEHLNYMSGIPPFLRGPYSAMYPLRPGPSASMQASPQLRSPTPSTVAISPPARKVSL